MTEEADERAQKNTNVRLSSTSALPDAAGNNTADLTASTGSSVDGYMSVSTECHDGITDTEGGRVVQQLKDGRLSTTQLILRRGLTVFAAVGLLAVGASVHFLLPQLQISPSKTNFTLDRINATNIPVQVFPTALIPNEESQ